MLSAIVLAAGRSSRMGTLKPLLKYNNRSFLQLIIDNLKCCSIKEIIVVSGYQSEKIIEHIKTLNVSIALNPDYSDGQITSIKSGLNKLSNHSNAFILCLTDRPLVHLSTYKSIINANRKHPDNIIIPSYSKRRGHPVIFPRLFYNDLLNAPLDKGARYVVDKHSSSIVYCNVDDENILSNIDTPEDYKRLINGNR